MASTSHTLPTFDDDDGFDWESAIKEIDAACNNQSLNANYDVGFGHKSDSNKPVSSRQSTLDGFVGLKGAKPVNKNVINDGNDGKDDGLGEGESGVRIDPEAAETWIYPDFMGS